MTGDNSITTGYRTVRIFISSTFRDMQAERDQLVRFVFPKLRKALLAVKIHVVEVDLRWGVTSDQDTVRTCKDIIDECHPRFLCMLGERYGWIPPGMHRSITAEEIHYAVLDRDPSDCGHAFFYFRDAKVSAEMEETRAGEFREPPGSAGQHALHELKTRIENAGFRPFVYRGRWDKDRKRLIDLKDFGDQVYTDLMGSIAQEIRHSGQERLDQLLEEYAAMEAFIEEHTNRFMLGSRAKVAQDLIGHVENTFGNGYLILTGAAGSGKSALLAYLAQYLANHASSSTYVIFHFVGVSPDSTNISRTVKRLCEELKRTCPEISDEFPADSKILYRMFADVLQTACAKRRIIILLDAVNQFDTISHYDGLSWLPEYLPVNARVVISSLEGAVLDELRLRAHHPMEIELQPLTGDDSQAIIGQFCKRFRKELAPAERSALLGKTDAGTPLYLLAALEEIRTFGIYEEISKRIAELPPTTQELFAWILKRLENEDCFLDGTGQHIGRKLVSQFAGLLAASRYGLSQQEIEKLIRDDDKQGNVAALLYLLRPYLMMRGGLIDFYHEQFRIAAQSLWLKTNEQSKSAHAELANYFIHEADPTDDQRWLGRDPRPFRELPYHLYLSKSAIDRKQILKSSAFLDTMRHRFPELHSSMASDPTIEDWSSAQWEGRTIYEFSALSIEDLKKEIETGDANHSIMAIRTLASLGDLQAIPVIFHALNDSRQNDLYGSTLQCDEEEAIFVSSEAAQALVVLGYAACVSDVYRKAAAMGYDIVICQSYSGLDGLRHARQFCSRLFMELRDQYPQVRCDNLWAYETPSWK